MVKRNNKKESKDETTEKKLSKVKKPKKPTQRSAKLNLPNLKALELVETKPIKKIYKKPPAINNLPIAAVQEPKESLVFSTTEPSKRSRTGSTEAKDFETSNKKPRLSEDVLNDFPSKCVVHEIEKPTEVKVVENHSDKKRPRSQSSNEASTVEPSSKKPKPDDAASQDEICTNELEVNCEMLSRQNSPKPEEVEVKFQVYEQPSLGVESHSEMEVNDDECDRKEKKQPEKFRCVKCQKKLGLTAIKCRCGGFFCAKHRYSNEHDCTFDYHELGRAEIQRNNPLFVNEKIKKI